MTAIELRPSGKSPFLMDLRQSGVLGRPFSVCLRMFFIQGAQQTCRYSNHKGERLHDTVLRDQRSSGDDAAPPDHRSGQDDRTHADQTFRFNRTCMQNRTMAYRNIFLDHAGSIVHYVQNRTILDIAIRSDLYVIDIPTEYDVVPDRRSFSQAYVSDDLCTPSNEYTGINRGVGVQHVGGNIGFVHL